MHCTVDSRLPITSNVLQRLVVALSHTDYSRYEKRLYKSMYTLTYFALLRISEYVVTRTSNVYPIQFRDVKLKIFDDGKLGFTFVIRSYKNCYTLPSVINVHQYHVKSICAVANLTLHLKDRPEVETSNLFVFANGEPVTQSSFTLSLKKCLKLSGLPIDKYKPHSFRSGRASDLFAQNCTLENIMRKGRWKSSAAVQRYIRITTD